MNSRNFRSGLFLCGIPALFLLIFILHYGTNLPYYDQFRFLRSWWEIKYQNAPLISNLWREHNEHRLFFPLVIMFYLAKVTHWNIKCELGVIWLLSLLTYLVFCHQYYRLKKQINSNAIINFFLFALLIFSPAAWENWLWGWQIQMALMFFCVVAGTFLLTKKEFNFLYFSGAILLGIIAAYSYATGLLFWILGLPAIFFTRWNRKTKIMAALFWAISAALVFALYFHNYGHNPNANVKGISLESPLALILYVLIFIGAPLAAGKVFLGLLFGIITFFLSLYIFIKNKLWRNEEALPFIFLWLFAAAAAAIIGLGRLESFGIHQALSPRYITISNLFYISLIAIPATCDSEEFLKDRLRIFAILCVFALSLANYGDGFLMGRAFAIKLHKAKNQLLSGTAPTPETLAVLHPRPDKALLMIERLKHEKLSVFR